jgi:hypothetical protein
MPINIAEAGGTPFYSPNKDYSANVPKLKELLKSDSTDNAVPTNEALKFDMDKYIPPQPDYNTLEFPTPQKPEDQNKLR